MRLNLSIKHLKFLLGAALIALGGYVILAVIVTVSTGVYNTVFGAFGAPCTEMSPFTLWSCGQFWVQAARMVVPSALSYGAVYLMMTLKRFRTDPLSALAYHATMIVVKWRIRSHRSPASVSGRSLLSYETRPASAGSLATVRALQQRDNPKPMYASNRFWARPTEGIW